MEKTKAILFSGTGVKILNVLFFFLSAAVRNSGIKLAAYFVWILYLIAAIRNTDDKTIKKVYLGIILYAIAMIALNIFLWLP